MEIFGIIPPVSALFVCLGSRPFAEKEKEVVVVEEEVCESECVRSILIQIDLHAPREAD